MSQILDLKNISFIKIYLLLFQDANEILQEAQELAEMKQPWNSSALKNLDTILIRAIARNIMYVFSVAPCWSHVREALCTGTRLEKIKIFEKKNR